MEHENKNVFRYVEQLLKGHLCNNYNIGIFASKHNDIDPKLKDLKDIIIRYYPQRTMNCLTRCFMILSTMSTIYIFIA